MIVVLLYSVTLYYTPFILGYSMKLRNKYITAWTLWLIMIIILLNRIGNAVYLLKWIKNHVQDKAVEANPQQENNFVFLSPFHSIFVIYTPSMLSERISVSSCCEKEIRDFKN